MLAPLCFSCPRCLLLKRGGSLHSVVQLSRGLADHSSSNSSSSSSSNDGEMEIPAEPTTCCMSGCANCVWLDYAQTLSRILNDNDERAREIILAKITDPNLKMFLSLELRNIKLLREKAEDPKTPK